MSTTTTRPRANDVKSYVLRQLATGVLGEGDALPTEGELAETLGAARHSIRRAMGELAEAGVVQRVQGRGTFVCDQPVRETARKSDAYALILPEVCSGIYPSLIKGFGQGAAASHQQSIVAESDMDMRVQGDVILRLLYSDTAGVAIVPVVGTMPDYQFQSLHSNNIPVVFCHRRPDGFDAPLITWSWEDVGRLAASTLADLGHRKIAVVDMKPTPVDEASLEGVRAELARRGIELPEDQIILGDQVFLEPNDPRWDGLISRVLDRPDRATAVFCADDLLSEHLYMAAMQRGLRVPDDLSIIGFGPTWRDGALRAKLAAVAIDEIEIGRRAVKLLDEMRAGRRPLNSSEVVTVPLELIEGQSLGVPAEG